MMRKRILAYLMSLVMILSNVTVVAAENGQENQQETESCVPQEESETEYIVESETELLEESETVAVSETEIVSESENISQIQSEEIALNSNDDMKEDESENSTVSETLDEVSETEIISEIEKQDGEIVLDNSTDEKSGQCGENVYWRIDENGKLTIYGTGDMWNYHYVANLAPWKDYSSEIKSLCIQEGVTKIGEYAFYDCSGFTGDLIIPDSVTIISTGAFYDCSGFTGDLIIPDSVSIIGSSAFTGCSGFTGNLKISENITSIEGGVFYNCTGLTGKLVIPDRVTSIGNFAFENCSGFTGNLIIPSGVIIIKANAFMNCNGFNGILTIPNSVTSIGEKAFSGCCNLIGDLIIPDEITSIDSYTFYSCSGFNGKLKLSKNLKKIGYSAFEGCRSLKGDLTIPDGLETINAWAFSSCTSLDGKLTIPDSVTEFEGSAFAFCNSLTGNPVIPEGSTKIGVRLYDGCSSLTGTLKIPNGVTIIEGYAFHACSGLTGNIKIPKGVKSIGERAFSECSGFTGDLVLPNGIETLGEYAFEKCSNLSGKVYIPKSVTEISYYTFYKMSNLCIYGIKGSYAETFANYFKIPFIAVDESVWDEPVEPESGSETESSSEQESGSELESFSEAESESEPESSSEPESGSEPESSSEAESESEPESVDENEILPEDMPEGGISAVPKDVWVVGVSNEGYSYTGKAIQPKVRVYDYTKRLMVGKDYTVTYKNNTNANSSAGSKTVPSVVVKTKGNYEGTKTVPFQISAIDLNSTDITADDIVVAYNNKVQKKVPILTFNGKKLANNKDFNVSYPSTGQGAYQEEGTYEILVTAKSNGNYTGTRTIKLVIEKKELISKATVKKIADQPYTGSVIIPSIQVSYKNKVLSEGTDYTLNYNNNVEIGTATVNISGIGDYAGTKKVTFKITGQSLKNAKVKGFSNVVYNGNEQTPKPQVEVNGATLKENEDYKVEYQKNVNAGKATLIITGMNAYTGTKKVTFNILAYDLGQDTDKSLTGWSNSIIAKYTKGGSQPKIKIQFKGKELVEGQDYTISYKNNKSVTSAQTKNQPTVTIKGKGNFKGSLTKSFVITQKDLNDSEQSVTMIVADVAFVDKAGKYISKPILTDVDGKKLVVGTDYEKNIEYKLEDGTVLNKDNKVEIGKKITVTVTGKGAYAGTKSVTYLITKSDFNKAKISISSKAYTGKAVVLGEKDIMVKIGNETLKYGEDYEIVPGSYTNNIKKGTASVTIKGKGNYGGLKQAKFKITAKRF